METLVNLISEMHSQNHFNVGQTVITDEGEHYTVCENIDMNDTQRKMLIYNDLENPERQQFVDGSSDRARSENKISPQKLTPVLDLNEDETLEAARNSVLADVEVIGKLIDLMKDNSDSLRIGSLSPLTTRSLLTSISRGLMNMFKAMKQEYIELLSQNTLFNKMVSSFVNVSGESSFPYKDELRDLVQKEQHLQYRKQAWTTKGYVFEHSKVQFNEAMTKGIFRVILYDYDEKKSTLCRHREFESFTIKECYKSKGNDSSYETNHLYCHSLET